MPATTKFQHVTVQLSGLDGNAFAILGRVTKALKANGATPAEVDAFVLDATDGDYQHLLATCMSWVDVS